MLHNVVLSSRNLFAGTVSNFSIELDEHFIDSQKNYMMTMKWIQIDGNVIATDKKCLKLVINGLTYPFTFSKEPEKAIAMIYNTSSANTDPILNHYYCNNKRIVRFAQNILNIKLIDVNTNLPVQTLSSPNNITLEFTLNEL